MKKHVLTSLAGVALKPGSTYARPVGPVAAVPGRQKADRHLQSKWCVYMCVWSSLSADWASTGYRYKYAIARSNVVLRMTYGAIERENISPQLASHFPSTPPARGSVMPSSHRLLRFLVGLSMTCPLGKRLHRHL